MRTRTRITLAGLVLGVASAGGVAWATSTTDSGLFTACKLKATGTIRLIDPSGPSNSLLSHCLSIETQITWNQKGQPGLPGANGTNGTNGAKGLDGTNGSNGVDGKNGLDGATGAKGADGAPGGVGPKGEPGADGGPGPTGPQGPAGTNGAPGAPGSASAHAYNLQLPAVRGLTNTLLFTTPLVTVVANCKEEVGFAVASLQVIQTAETNWVVAAGPSPVDGQRHGGTLSATVMTSPVNLDGTFNTEAHGVTYSMTSVGSQALQACSFHAFVVSD